MRIVHLTASTFFGGPERQMLGLAGHLPADHASTFLSFSEGGRCRPFLTQARSAGFDAAELRYDTPNFRAAIREVTAFLRGNFADVLVTHGYKSNLLGRPAARAAGVPVVAVARGWTGENLKVWCYEAADRRHLRYMDHVVCVSRRQAEWVHRLGVPADRIDVIRNGARLRAFVAPDVAGRDRLRRLAGGDGPIVLAAGRLSPEKGFAVLVDAARQINEMMPDARIVVCGDGPERASLEKRVARLGLSQVVRLVGFRDDVDALLPWASVLALPSFTEGLPNVALEAGAAGVPVVATAVGGTPEVVVHDRTGYLVPAGNSGLLAAGVLDLLDAPQRARAFGLAGRQRVVEHFTFQAQAKAYGEVFENLRRPRVVTDRRPALAYC